VLPLVCAALFAAASAVAQAATPWTLADDAVKLTSGDQTIPATLKSPVFRFDDGPAVGNASPEKTEGSLDNDGTLTVLYSPIPLDGPSQLEVRLLVQASAKESVLRKWARFRVTGGHTRLLKEIVIEDIDARGRKVRTFPGEIQSYPVLLDGFFAGIEFPISATRIEGDHILMAHSPGLRVEPGVEYESRKAVFGCASAGEELRAFRRYILAHRPPPGTLHVDYNSWWTSPAPYYTEKDILDLMDVFRTRLYEPYKASFDTFCIDMGWSNMKSLWEIDTKLFPEGFSRIQRAAEAMNSRLGLWISPCSGYPTALDVNWAKENGYEALAGALCLGGKRYQTAFKERLVDMVTRYGVRQIKLDGYRLTCPENDHGHEPGPLSAEPIAEGIIAAAEAVHRVAPDTWLEPTCFGLNPSPWWLFFFNSAIGSFGDDAPNGRVPAPVYRESYTTARDFFNLQGAYWNPAPQAAQEVLGIIHQTTEPFMNDAVMTVLRGHMFLPLYLNPRYMDDPRWKSLAALLAWARANAASMTDTAPLLPRSWQDGKCPKFTAEVPMPREPYGYAHWRDVDGLVVLRNPWIAPQTYPLVLAEHLKLPSETDSLSVVSLYPEPRVYGHPQDGVLDVPLAPYETVVLSLWHGQVVEGLPSAQQVLSGQVAASDVRFSLIKTEYEGDTGGFGPNWTSLVGDASAVTDLSVNARMAVRAQEAEILVLLDGSASTELPGTTLRISEKDVPLTTSSSETGWSATGADRPEHWLFLCAPLPHGESNVSLTLPVADEGVKVSVWVWAKKPGNAAAELPNGLMVLPAPETISLDSVALMAPTDLSQATVTEVKRAPRPVEKIDGVFLDAIDPISASQGYGTLQKNKSVWEKPMKIAGKHFRRGLGTHSPSRIVYALDGKFRRFQAWAGADSATAPTVTFEVWVDGQKRWESGLMTQKDDAKPVDVDVTNAKELDLIGGDGGNGIVADHADWAEARLLY
jgi:hypothetical protein